MVVSVFAAAALTVAPVTGIFADQWQQASKYDTIISLFPAMASTSAFAGKSIKIAPGASAGKVVWNAFERGSSGGFDLASLLDVPDKNWSGIQIVRELRQLSGLTWQKAAELVGVSAKTLHNWAAGERMAEKNLRKLGDLLAVLRFIDRGYSDANRDLLLSASIDGATLFSLIRLGDFDRVKAEAGRGVGRVQPASPTRLAAPNHMAPDHFGTALSASLADISDDIVPAAATGKRLAKARRKG